MFPIVWIVTIQMVLKKQLAINVTLNLITFPLRLVMLPCDSIPPVPAFSAVIRAKAVAVDDRQAKLTGKLVGIAVLRRRGHPTSSALTARGDHFNGQQIGGTLRGWLDLHDGSEKGSVHCVVTQHEAKARKM